MKRRIVLFAAVLFLLSCRVTAQMSRPSIRFLPFLADGISADEKRLIESLIISYLSDFADLISALPQYPEAALPNSSTEAFGSAIRADFDVSGSIHMDQDSRIFMLRVSIPSREDDIFTSTYRSAGEMLLKVRSLLENAFPGGSTPGQGAMADSEMLTVGLITGSWEGEEGIDIVHLQRSGKGVIVFSSGAQMIVNYSIHDNTLKVVQSSPNSPRYYDLPPEAAQKMADRAPPMEWQFMLYEKGGVLRGVKLAAKAEMQDDILTRISMDDVQEVEWRKSAR